MRHIFKALAPFEMRLWRKNRSRNEDTCTPPGSCCMGVSMNCTFNDRSYKSRVRFFQTDLNRNFDSHFGGS